MSKKLFLLSALMPLVFGVPTAVHSQDHSLLSGMPGYKINGRKLSEFGMYDEGNIFYCQAARKCTAQDPGFDDQGHLVAQGKVTAINYSSTSPAGTLAVFKNYENAIKGLGGRRISHGSGHEGTHVFLVDRNGAQVWIVLANDYDSNYKLSFIESGALKQVVTAGQLADSIASQGYATLYIEFDNNRSEIRSEARPSLDEVVALLRNTPELALSIEGHTDNVGAAAANQKLSLARARSVMEALVAAGIAARRLQSKGLGSQAPIADNRTDDGRARNRRVELVRMK